MFGLSCTVERGDVQPPLAALVSIISTGKTLLRSILCCKIVGQCEWDPDYLSCGAPRRVTRLVGEMSLWRMCIIAYVCLLLCDFKILFISFEKKFARYMLPGLDSSPKKANLLRGLQHFDHYERALGSVTPRHVPIIAVACFVIVSTTRYNWNAIVKYPYAVWRVKVASYVIARVPTNSPVLHLFVIGLIARGSTLFQRHRWAST